MVNRKTNFIGSLVSFAIGSLSLSGGVDGLTIMRKAVQEVAASEQQEEKVDGQGGIRQAEEKSQKQSLLEINRDILNEHRLEIAKILQDYKKDQEKRVERQRKVGIERYRKWGITQYPWIQESTDVPCVYAILSMQQDVCSVKCYKKNQMQAELEFSDWGVLYQTDQETFDEQSNFQTFAKSKCISENGVLRSEDVDAILRPKDHKNDNLKFLQLNEKRGWEQYSNVDYLNPLEKKIPIAQFHYLSKLMFKYMLWLYILGEKTDRHSVTCGKTDEEWYAFWKQQLYEKIPENIANRIANRRPKFQSNFISTF